MERKELLRSISFGARVAEEETSELATYFVETDQWDRLFRGAVDVIKGDKGTGKSAIYSLLLDKSSELFDKRILLIPAERPQGAPAFKELTTDPPATEDEFMGLWKLYILTLIARSADDYGINSIYMRELKGRLIDQGLLESDFDLIRVLKKSLQYVRSWIKPRVVEATVTVDPNTLAG
jgi:hypothetical protein